MPYIGKQPANVPVTADDIPNDSITAAKIVDAAITIDDIGPNAVGNSEMADDAIGLNELSATGTTNSSTFLRGDNSWAVPPNTVYTHPNHSGDVTSSADGATTIANNAVTTAKIAGDAITALKIADDVINATHIEDGQILTAALGDDAVTAAKLANSINTDIATGVTGNTTANAALPKAGGTMTGNLTVSRSSGNAVTRLQGASNSQSSKLFISHTSSGSGGLFYSGNVFDIFSYGDIRINSGTGNVNDTIANERIRIKNDGKVGIGTTSPSKKLEIAVSGTDGLLMSGANGYVGSTNDLVIDMDSNNDYSGNVIKFTQHNGASELMRITDSGKVGIGETAPESNLVIKRATAATTAGSFAHSLFNLHVHTASDEYSQITFGYAGGGGAYASAYLGYQNKDTGNQGKGDLVFGTRNATTDSTAPTERMRIDSSGNVAFAASATGGANIIGVSGDQADRNNGGYPQYTFVGNQGTGMRRPASNQLAFDTSGDEAMRINASGNVGIGTTPPSATSNSSYKQLFVNSGGALVDSGGSGPATMVLNNSYIGSGNNNYATLAQKAARIVMTSGRLTFDTAPSVSANAQQTFAERMRITDAGNVGIGTSSPADKIHLNESGATSSFIRFSNSNISNGWSLGANSGGRFQITQNGVADRLAISTGGVVSAPNGIELGSGIDATAANTLDDYEEGTATLTPVTQGGSIALKSTHNTLKYTKIGNKVFWQFHMRVNSASSPTGWFKLTGLPFAPASGEVNRTNITGAPVYNWASPSGSMVTGYIVEGDSEIWIYFYNGSTGMLNSANYLQANTEAYFSGSYSTT